MIPVRLALSDFLSYRDPPPIDFGGFSVACITGSNGRGKSALLDAMTFALFGAARGCEGGRNTERLIRDGAERASVDLTFELGDQTYRIARTRTRAGKGSVRLLVHTADSWTNLAGENVRETEARIAGLLRMDYQTFTASAFLLQGRADDFITRLEPERRKDVLVRLLDLGVYERLEEGARAHGREVRGRQAALAAQIEARSGLGGEVERAREELAVAGAAAEEAVRLAGESEAALADLASDLAALETKLALAVRERESIDSLKRRTASATSSLARADTELAELSALLEREPDVADALASLRSLEEIEAGMQEAARRSAELDQARAAVEGRISAEAQGLQARRSAAVARVSELEAEIEVLRAREAELRAAEVSLGELDGAESALAGVRGRLDERRTEGASVAASIVHLEERRAETADRRALIARGEGTCPVCRGPLDAPHRRRIAKELEADARALVRDIAAAEARREETRKEWKLLKEESGRLEADVARRNELARAVAALAPAVALAPDRAAQVASLREEAAGHELALASGAFAMSERAGLERITDELAVLGYDAGAHDDVRRRIGELAPSRSVAGRIAQAKERLGQARAEHDELVVRIAEDAADLAHRREVLAALESEAERAQAVRSRVAEATGSRDARRLEAARHADAAARLEARLDALLREAEELERTRAEERDAAAEHRRWTRLTQAFGRGGIPDLILENALPELTHEANQILAQLSDCEMSVQFAMTRETRSGRTRETFDVRVFHDGGVRDFAMFSGGEAFRIAFAIRLGLSKLLVRRAGARLETLVVDEGFGTQDAQGRERLLEGITLARREFRKVLVITHLDDLKDAFGTQIQVTKDAQRGSLVRIIGS